MRRCHVGTPHELLAKSVVEPTAKATRDDGSRYGIASCEYITPRVGQVGRRAACDRQLGQRQRHRRHRRVVKLLAANSGDALALAALGLAHVLCLFLPLARCTG